MKTYKVIVAVEVIVKINASTIREAHDAIEQQLKDRPIKSVLLEFGPSFCSEPLHVVSAKPRNVNRIMRENPI